MMSRNYKYFATLKLEIREELAKQLQAYKALGEQTNDYLKAAKPTTATGTNAKVMSPYEEFLEKNTLVSRIVLVGMDQPHIFYKTIPHRLNPPISRVRVLERY